jgi:DNA-binding NarL/FixJ family response regulator
MQLKLPLFPIETKLFNASFGVFSKDGMVFYLHCGQPVGMHEEEDHNAFRNKIAGFVELGLCTQSEVVKTLHVSMDSVRRSCKQYREHGEAAFFAPDRRKGSSHKMLPQVLRRIQAQLNEGKSVNSIAKQEGVREGTIRYSIQTGKLKKKIP